MVNLVEIRKTTRNYMINVEFERRIQILYNDIRPVDVL